MATPVVAADAVPLAVWDVRCGWFGWEHWHEVNEWAMAHLSGVPGRFTYRAEFYLVDVPFAVLFRYAEDDRGRPYLDPLTGEPAVAEPVLQVLDALPPEHLLGPSPAGEHS